MHLKTRQDIEKCRQFTARLTMNLQMLLHTSHILRTCRPIGWLHIRLDYLCKSTLNELIDQKWLL
jgi:hypothetical protein